MSDEENRRHRRESITLRVEYEGADDLFDDRLRFIQSWAEHGDDEAQRAGAAGGDRDHAQEQHLRQLRHALSRPAERGTGRLRLRMIHPPPGWNRRARSEG